MGGGIVPSSVGTLNLRADVLQAFTAVREKHMALQVTLHQVMRRVVLPQAREIGEELARLKALYPKGKKGSGSSFYSDCQTVTGLGRAMVANYVLIFQGWGRLMDYMTDLPEGATPVTSVRSALEALRAMNRPELPPRSDAVDVEAEPVEGSITTSRKRTSYASSTRERALPALDALMAAATVSDHHKAQLAKVREALTLLLEQIEAAEAKAAEAQAQADAEAEAAREPVDLPPPAWSEVEPEPEPEPVVVPTPPTPATPEPEAEAEADEGGGKVQLPVLFPFTAEGLAAFELALAEAGSGSALARQLGCTKQAISGHKNRLRKAEAAGWPQ
jgi:hypothetical protein